MNIIIKEDNLSHPKVQALLAHHQKDMIDNSPEYSDYTLGLSELLKEGITIWTLWQGEKLMGMGALHELSARWAEIKSMRAHPDHLGKGVGTRLMEHMIDTARARGYTKLSLETGTTPTYDAAIRLYKKYGFKTGAVFSDYEEGPYNQFMHLSL